VGIQATQRSWWICPSEAFYDRARLAAHRMRVDPDTDQYGREEETVQFRQQFHAHQEAPVVTAEKPNMRLWGAIRRQVR